MSRAGGVVDSSNLGLDSGSRIDIGHLITPVLLSRKRTKLARKPETQEMNSSRFSFFTVGKYTISSKTTDSSFIGKVNGLWISSRCIEPSHLASPG